MIPLDHISHKYLGAYREAYYRAQIVFHLLGHDLPDQPGMFVSELHAMMKDYFSDDELLGILHYIDSHPVRELKKLKKLTLKKVDKEQPE